jgi:hypothetical protein
MANSNVEYTKELLEPLVKTSYSVAQVLRKLGKRLDGGVHSHLSKTIKNLELDTSHFTGQRSNCGPNHKGGLRRRTWQEVLVLRANDRRKEDTYLLRRALIEFGREYVCSNEKCKIAGEWLGQEITLEINHKDCDWSNNKPENLEFLCPNCHSQYHKFLTQSKRKHNRQIKTKSNKSNHCVDCNKAIYNKSTRCKSCQGKTSPNKINWPPTNVLIEMVQQSNYLAVSRQLGVSDNAIRKRIKNHAA